MNSANSQLGLLFVTVSAIAWSTAGLFTRLIALDSWTMLVWRGIFGAAGIMAVMWMMQGRQSLRGLLHMRTSGWLFVAVGSAGMILFITALRFTTVAHAAVIYATVPLIAACLGWLVMREKPSRSAVIASVAALVGVIVMVGLGLEGGWLGNLLALGMALCMAALMIMARRFRDIPTMPAAGLSALLSAFLCWPLAQPLSVTGSDLVLLALFGVVNSALGMVFFALGARLLPVVQTALIGALDAPLAPLWVWLAFGETPSSATMVGGVIVFAAVTVHMVKSVHETDPRGS